MTLDEAIEHAESCVNETPCGQAHAQLAAWLRELRALRKTPGNATAMSAALADALKFLRTNRYGYFESRLIPQIEAALETPARNVDRFQTLDEAREAFQKLRGHKVWADVELWDSMDEAGAFVRWLFSQTEKGGPK